ncbi:MAG: GNAT family N-acetyltransferase [Polyangiaceae bacterium]
MRVVELTPEYESLFFRCLEDWNPETEVAVRHRACWYHSFRERGLRVKLALDDSDRVGGMIQYLPIEHAPARGRDLYFILCIWVHGHAQGRGNFQGHGMGSALLAAAEADACALGAKGMAAWGLVLPFWMRASWFRKLGYRKADRSGVSGLVWKPFVADAEPPRWLPSSSKRPARVPGQVVVTACSSGWCVAQAIALERARSAASEFGDDVSFQIIDTKDRTRLLEWGATDALFVDDQPIWTGPPPSRERLVRQIVKRVRRLPRAPARDGRDP